ncbi:LamG domain-containing protein [Biformimicrobium ophioploci]|uniref:LamG-like jellyroll fold domain-containing protein n=1 Tax=Biformimicrobium ophioploci TaxID=3036711 RepID=A0ABQ6M178_9GAMM|nr:LamG domain-containing protein [Microbulbifer sp. NKW57]GMG88082.1 hypothetical protein MNKW57_24030 [Microbulbifer sp. NKW57]
MKLLNALTILASLSLAACSGGSGQETTSQPNTDTGSSAPSTYTGPAPQSDDVQQYKINIWDNLRADNRCGSCHNESQSPRFVRFDDINLAYSEGRPLVDLNTPAESRLVTKVAEGHNCWLDSADACASIITNYIEAWAKEAGSLSTEIVLTAPPIREIGTSKTFPADGGNFSTTVYPLLTTYCASCHSESARFAQQPYFASADVEQAYEAAKTKMDLVTPENSRFSIRLGAEFHNCWSDCAANEDEMTAAITSFANAIPLAQVDPAWVTSKALYLPDGIVASGGGRVENHLVALYEFKTGSGTTAYDTSGVEPAMDLALSGNYEWLGSWGVRFNEGKAQAATVTSKKLFDLLSVTGEYTLEAWVAPANVVQDGPVRIVSYAGGNEARNFALGQNMYNYVYSNRAANTDADGMPALITNDADEVAQATLQHVVASYDPLNGRRLYVNGELVVSTDPLPADTLSNWDDTFAFALGNEVSGEYPWQGSVRMVAVHSRALTPEDITANFEAGVGEKYFLLFSVEEHTGVAESYVLVEVQQFDNYGYLFSLPKLMSLDPDADLSGVVVEGMRIGINGREAEVGQAYANLDVSVETGTVATEGLQLSPLGTIIGLELGAENDEFFLTFERLGSSEFVRVEPVPAAPAPAADLPEQPRLGLRRFAQINASLSRATGISTTDPDIAATYDKVRQQLPIDPAIDGFVAAHQMGITQLAVKYCSVLVDSPERAGFFPGFDFTAPADSAFAGGNDSLIVDPLLKALLVEQVSGPAGMAHIGSAPEAGAMRAELQSLIGKMTACVAGCDANRTATTVKAACAAAMGSAAILVH